MESNHRTSRFTAQRLRLGLLGLALIPLSAFAQGPRPPAAVEVVGAQLRQLTPTVTATGQVQSRAGAELAAGVEGRLEFVAEPGTRVDEGDLVARIDTAAIALQRVELAARVTRSEVALRQADRELARLRDSGNAVSRYQLDQAENTRDLSASDLQIAEAALRQTEERLSRAQLKAPFAGVISERLRREGEEVDRGDPIARLQDTEHLEIRLFLPLRHVRAIKSGSEVQILTESGASTRARVRAIVPVGEARSQSFEALIDVPELDPPLSVGRTVSVELPLAGVTQSVAVPRDALVIREDGISVYRIRDGAAQRVPVATGVAAGDWVAVEGALAADDPVVVRGAETLHDGDPVNIVGERGTWTTGSMDSMGYSER